ncbi:MAG TPA: hypothetical protein VM123_10825, partial [archaeon]|nr:hypothetical protein [archaeon]
GAGILFALGQNHNDPCPCAFAKRMPAPPSHRCKQAPILAANHGSCLFENSPGYGIFGNKFICKKRFFMALLKI